MARERKQKERRLLEKRPEDGGGLARSLGSTDDFTREKGLQALTLWLSGHKDVTEGDLLRLWKAMFYCFWHSDKTPVQNALAERLSELMSQVPPAVGLLYFKVFLRTMRREWFGIDRHRLDKFMMLIRKFYAQHLRFLQAAGWDEELLSELAEFWRAEVLAPSDTLVAAGVAYHISDLFLPELFRVVQEAQGVAPSGAVLSSLLAPFCTALASTGDNVLVDRLHRGLFKSIAEEVQAPGEADALRHLDGAALAERLFELGAREEVRSANRRALYAASEALEQAAKLRSSSGVASGSAPKKVTKKQRQEEAPVAMEAEAAPAKAKKRKPTAEGGEAAEKPLKGGKEKKAKLGGAEPKAAKSAEDAAAATTTVGSGTAEKQSKNSEKKKKKGKLEAALVAEDEEAVATPLGVKSSSGKKKGKRGAALAAAAAALGGPEAETSTPVASPTANGSESMRKSVRFSLKRNLVMTIGQKPLPEDVRTPPTSKPKGSALKKSSLGPAGGSGSSGGLPGGRAHRRLVMEPSNLGPGRGAGGSSHQTPAGTRSASKATQPSGKWSKSAGKSPRSAPRPKAADFF